MIRAPIPPNVFRRLAQKTTVFTCIRLDKDHNSIKWKLAWLEEDLGYPQGENKTGRIVEVNYINTQNGTYLVPTDRDVMWSI